MAGKKHLKRSKLIEHVPPKLLCKCGKLGEGMQRCPLADVFPGADSSPHCNCCLRCRTKCWMEV